MTTYAIRLQETGKSIPAASSLLEAGLAVGEFVLLLYASLLAKRIKRKALWIERQLKNLDDVPDEDLPMIQEVAANLGKAATNCGSSAERCREIQTHGTPHSVGKRLLMHVLVKDLEWLEERFEDLSETLALSAHKPFTDLVAKELGAHG